MFHTLISLPYGIKYWTIITKRYFMPCCQVNSARVLVQDKPWQNISICVQICICTCIYVYICIWICIGCNNLKGSEWWCRMMKCDKIFSIGRHRKEITDWQPSCIYRNQENCHLLLQKYKKQVQSCLLPLDLWDFFAEAWVKVKKSNILENQYLGMFGERKIVWSIFPNLVSLRLAKSRQRPFIFFVFCCHKYFSRFPSLSGKFLNFSANLQI